MKFELDWPQELVIQCRNWFSIYSYGELDLLIWKSNPIQALYEFEQRELKLLHRNWIQTDGLHYNIPSDLRNGWRTKGKVKIWNGIHCRSMISLYMCMPQLALNLKLHHSLFCPLLKGVMWLDYLFKIPLHAFYQLVNLPVLPITITWMYLINLPVCTRNSWVLLKYEKYIIM